jgi:hypothetical protein
MSFSQLRILQQGMALRRRRISYFISYCVLQEQGGGRT